MQRISLNLYINSFACLAVYFGPLGVWADWYSEMPSGIYYLYGLDRKMSLHDDSEIKDTWIYEVCPIDLRMVSYNSYTFYKVI